MMSRSGRPSRVPLAVRLVQVCLASSLLVYLASLTLRNDAGYDVVFEGWVANFALAMCPLLCLLRVLWQPAHRAAFACLGLGGLFFTAGNIVYVAHV
ncbi:MAG TPA: hypothetical protein VNO51_20865, partial [Ilumatobacteraceae bacterium]|nr:hypothetical protein [Ilumatobacteraceae bacterium]